MHNEIHLLNMFSNMAVCVSEINLKMKLSCCVL